MAILHIVYASAHLPPQINDAPCFRLVMDAAQPENLSCLDSVDWEGVHAVVADGMVPEEIHALLSCLRADPKRYLLPIFVSTRLEPLGAALADGEVRGLSQALEQAAVITARLAELPEPPEQESREHLLLAMLYSRAMMPLLPVAYPASPYMYCYPLASVLYDPAKDIRQLLKHLQQRGLMEPDTLIDRLRSCTACGSSRINYVDVSPLTGSINIIKKTFLHCFTCGHVAPTESFNGTGKLICPNCSTILRHIGTDYDRATESYVCQDTGNAFVDPKIIARCLDCGMVHDTSDLDVQLINSLRLTDKGRMSVLTGSVSNIYSFFDNLNYITPGYFNHFLDWQIHMSKRFPDDHFSLIGMRLTNLPQFINAFGRAKTAELVETMAKRLRELIRTTDISTRGRSDIFWMLLPKTPAVGCKVLLQRIAELADYTRQPDGTKLECSFVQFTAPEDLIGSELSDLLLPRLASAIADE